MRPTEGLQKETGQLGGFNDETGAQSRVKTNRNRLLVLGVLVRTDLYIGVHAWQARSKRGSTVATKSAPPARPRPPVGGVV